MPECAEILKPEDVAKGITFILGSPLHVTIAELLMVPTAEKYWKRIVVMKRKTKLFEIKTENEKLILLIHLH